MKKTIGLILVVVMILGCATFFTGCGSNAPANQGGENPSGGDQPEKTYEFVIAHLQAPESTPAAQFTHLKETLEEKSSGRIKVTIHPGGTMASSDPELAELCRAGTVQMVPIPTHALSALVNIPEYKIFEMPYIFSDWEEVYKVLDSDLAKQWAKPLEEQAGVKVYGGLVKGWLSVGLKGADPLSAPSDLKGKKIRTMSTDMQMGLIKSLGGSPTSVAYGELYTAIQQGTVDGSLTATNLYVSDRFGEVVDSLSIIRATAHFHLPTINLKWYNELPDDLKAIFDECMEDYLNFARDLEKKADSDAISELETNMNVKVKQFTDEELAPFRAATKPLFDENKAACGDGVVDSVLELLGKKEDEIFGR